MAGLAISMLSLIVGVLLEPHRPRMRFAVLISGPLRHANGAVLAVACAHLASQVPTAPHAPHPVNWVPISGKSRRNPNNVQVRCVLRQVTMVQVEHTLGCQLGCCKHVHPPMPSVKRSGSGFSVTSNLVAQAGSSPLINPGCGCSSMRGWLALAAMASVRALLAAASPYPAERMPQLRRGGGAESCRYAPEVSILQRALTPSPYLAPGRLRHHVDIGQALLMSLRSMV
mmetsp:Transcript_13584/g.24110  ORF Transcript_13584/g.24110 Transcript_13584/m.24110 type:complete len:228 (-) Transcript_13584:31-714(-)